VPKATVAEVITRRCRRVQRGKVVANIVRRAQRLAIFRGWVRRGARDLVCDELGDLYERGRNGCVVVASADGATSRHCVPPTGKERCKERRLPEHPNATPDVVNALNKVKAQTVRAIQAVNQAIPY